MAVVDYTTNLGLALPTTGDLAGLWGFTVNDSITALLDTAVAGTVTLNTDADVTLTDTDGVANQARAAVINWTATGTVTRNITAPKRSKVYVVFNNTGGTQSIVLRGGPTSPTTGVTVRAGQQAMVAWNTALNDFERVGGGDPGGSNTQVQFNGNGELSGSAGLTWNGTTLTATNLAAQSLTLSTTPLAIASGGTNTNATPTLGGVAYGTGTAYALTAAGTTGKVLTSNGSAAPTWENPVAPVVAGGALLTNTDTVTESYVIPVGTNAFSVGPITIADTYTVTVSAGQRWLVV
jgi:hypothetical protein